MISKDKFSELLNEHDVVEVSIAKNGNSQTFMVKPKVQFLQESTCNTEYMLFDSVTGKFVGFDFNDIRGVAIRA